MYEKWGKRTLMYERKVKRHEEENLQDYVMKKKERKIEKYCTMEKGKFFLIG